MRSLRRSVARLPVARGPLQRAALAGMALLALGAVAVALPGGTKPTRLETFPVSGYLNKNAVAKCRLTTLDGKGVAGMGIDLYAVSVSSSTRIATRVPTDSLGYASATINLSQYTFGKAGTYSIQWHFAGNGAYAEPLPMATVTIR